MSSDGSAGGGVRSPHLTRVVVAMAWILAAALAGAVVWWAVAVIGGERAGVLTQAEAAAELASQGGSATASSAPSTGSGPTPRPTPASSPSGASNPPPTGPAEVARTWDVAGGQVGASCRGAQIALLFATPQDGWTIEVKHAGPQEVEVEFRRGESETKIRAECSGGTPAEQIEEDGG